MIPADPRLLDPVIVAMAAERAQAKRQTCVDTAWERSVGLAALLQAARGHVVAVDVVYDAGEGEPPLQGERTWYARPGSPHHDGLQRLLDEARRYEATKREGMPQGND
jgi:hypothetical protein